jgi:hypothetical protein
MTEMSRREFAGSVMLAALVPVLGLKAAPPAVGWWEPAVAAAGDDMDALARALGEVVRARYGSRLSEADLATVTRQIRNGLERAEQVRKVDLANGDEPDFVFAALPVPGR